jgi:hypothetical protein
MPTQRRLRCDQAVRAQVSREQPRERRTQPSIGRSQLGLRDLAAKHRDLVMEDKQLDVFCPAIAVRAPDQQPKQGHERQIGEGEEHQPIFPGAEPGWRRGTQFWHPSRRPDK